MNKFLQVLLGLAAFVWLIIGLAMVVGVIALIKLDPISKIQAVAEDFGLPGEATRESSGSLGQEAQPSGEPTPQQLECFKRKLGDARFNEIMRSGGEPTAGDLAKARDCF